MVWISTGIAELEPDAVEDLWEPPMAFEDIDSLRTWIVHGKKGSGKSTIIDYWRTKDHHHRMVVIKPAEDQAFYESFAAFIGRHENEDSHLLVLLAERYLDVVVSTALMTHWYKRKQPVVATGGGVSYSGGRWRSARTSRRGSS